MIGVVVPGARVVIRDAEWLVRKVDTTSTGGRSIHAVGLSELVKDREAIFLGELERDIQILDPTATKLVPDTSPRFRDALLYIESLMRQTPPTDPPSEEKIYIGHKAAMDLVGYQLDPALQRDFGNLLQTTPLQLSRKEAEQRHIESLFTTYQTWIKETMTTEDKPCVRIVTVLRGDA